MPSRVVTTPDGRRFTVNYPEGATDDEILRYAQENAANLQAAPEVSAPPEQMPPAQPGQGTGLLQVAGEFANAANRSALEGLDYIGPGAVNAAARLSNEYLGTEFGQVPTLTGAFEENVPGAQGGFMPEGTARDVTRAAGSVLPVAASLTSVPRNLAKPLEAAKEFAGFGTQAPAGNLAAQYGDQAQALLGRSPVDIADAAGYPLTPGQRYDNKGLQILESAIDSTPMPFNPMHRVARQQQDVVNQASAEAIGLPGQTRITQENMGTVADDLSGEFNRLGLEDDIVTTEAFHDRVAEIEQAAKTRIFSDPELSGAIDRIMDRIDETGALGAIDYQDITSELKGKIRQAFAGQSPDPGFADSLSELVSAFDDLAEDQLDGAALARLKEARRKWRSFQALEKSRAVKESGDVSGPLLGNYLRKTDKGGYARGKNQSDMYDVARSAKAFPPRPDSGTAGRMLLQHPLLAMGGAAGGGAAAAMDPTYLTALLGLPLVGSGLANAYQYGAPAAIEFGRTAGRQIPLRPGALTSTIGALEDR